jgi:hypothetical protein
VVTIESIVCDPSLEVPQKSEHIVELLAAQPDHGVADAVACLLTTADERVAAFVADYLAIIPDAAADKTRAAERLRGAGLAGCSCSPSATRSRRGGRNGCAHTPRTSTTRCCDAACSREHQRAGSLTWSLAGTPNTTRTCSTPSPESALPPRPTHSWRCAQRSTTVRTGRSSSRVPGCCPMVTGARGVPRRSWASWWSGTTLRTSWVGRSRAMSRSARCAMPPPSGCSPWTPTRCRSGCARIRRFSGTPVTVRCWTSRLCKSAPTGCGYSTPPGAPSPGGALVPGERGLFIEPHPNQTGVSIDASGGGLGQHQVGGPPRWIEPDRHPRCPGCRRPMMFLASVSSGLTPFGRLGFLGTLYGFWCDAWAISTTRRQH